MNKSIIAFGIILATASSAFAQSSILDVMNQKLVTATEGVFVKNVGEIVYDFTRGRLGDGSPNYVAIEGSVGVDYTATASISVHSAYDLTRGRLGDGSPNRF